MTLISSKEHELVKLAVALQQKKTRDEKRLCLLEGLRLVEDALLAGWSISQLVVGEAAATEARVASLLAAAEARAIPTYLATEAVLKKIATTNSPQGVVAIAAQPPAMLPASAKGEVWLVADELQDPGNFGTILRSADAAGCNGVIMTGNGVDPFGPKAVRATMGSLFHLPVLRMTTSECLSFCDRYGLTLYVAGAEAAQVYSETNLAAPCAIVFGNEGAGVGEKFRQQAADNIKIPILGRAESLNVASAAAIILFEAARQKGWTLS